MKNLEITLYTTHCPKCEVLQAKLNSAGIEYTLCDDEEKLINKATEAGIMTAPFIHIFQEFTGHNTYKTFEEAIEWLNNGGGE